MRAVVVVIVVVVVANRASKSQRATADVVVVVVARLASKREPMRRPTTINITTTNTPKNMIYLPVLGGLSVCELMCTEQPKWIVQSVCKLTRTEQAQSITAASQSLSVWFCPVQKFKVAYLWKLKHCFLAKIISVEEILATKFLFVRK